MGIRVLCGVDLGLGDLAGNWGGFFGFGFRGRDLERGKGGRDTKEGIELQRFYFGAIGGSTPI